MVKVLSILLAFMVAVSFGGITFGKSLGDSSSIHSTFPLGSDDDHGDDDHDGDDEHMDDEEDDEDDEK